MRDLGNRYRGVVWMPFDGWRHALKYDWTAIAALKQEIGADFDSAINKAAIDLDLPVLAKALAIGFRWSHPEIDEAAIFKASPPIQDAFDAIRRGLKLAFHGSEDGPADAPAARPTMLDRLRSAIRSRRPAPRPTATA